MSASRTPSSDTSANAAAAPLLSRAVLREEAGTWVFVLRTMAAYFITGWLAMRFQLEQPSTAMVTTLIVMHRQSGMVLAKSFYRVIGTLVGAVVALLIVAAFPQQRELFLGATALWVGLCAGGATLYRNFKSYAFVLSGYTAAIVALPVIADPVTVFDSASSRVAEVLLGLLVSGVISDVVFPSRMRDTLRDAARTQFRDFIAFVRDGTAGSIAREAMERAHLRFVRDATTLEDLRSSVIFEDADTRAGSGRLQLFNQRFMAASTSFQSLHHLVNRMLRGGGDAVAAALVALYRPLADALAAPAPGATDSRALVAPLETAVAALPARVEAIRATMADAPARDDFDTGAALVTRFARELRDYVVVAASLREPGTRAGAVETLRFVRSNDATGAALAAARTVLVMAVLSVGWIVSGWPSGGSAMLLATIFCAIFATAPDPDARSTELLVGFAVGIVAAYVAAFVILPRMDGYGMLVAGIAPLFLAGCYVGTRPGYASYGLGYLLCLTTVTGIANTMHYDPAGFGNTAIAQLVGVGASVLAFKLLPSALGTRWLWRRQLAGLRRQVAFAARAPLSGLRAAFESISRDLFQQIVSQTAPGSDASRALLAWALAVHETGRALIALRQDADEIAMPAHLRDAIAAALAAVAALYEEPDAHSYVAARDRIVEAVDATRHALPAAPAAQGLLQHLHLIRISLVDAESVLAEFAPKTLSDPPQAVHAA